MKSLPWALYRHWVSKKEYKEDSPHHRQDTPGAPRNSQGDLGDKERLKIIQVRAVTCDMCVFVSVTSFISIDGWGGPLRHIGIK